VWGGEEGRLGFGDDLGRLREDLHQNAQGLNTQGLECGHGGKGCLWLAWPEEKGAHTRSFTKTTQCVHLYEPLLDTTSSHASIALSILYSRISEFYQGLLGYCEARRPLYRLGLC